MTPKDWIDLIQLVGLPVALLLANLLLVYRGKLHTNPEFQEMRDQRNRYRDQVERLTKVQEEAVPVVKQALVNNTDFDNFFAEARKRGLL